MSWQPVVDRGPLHDAARAAIADIVAAIHHADRSAFDLAGGITGRAVFYGHLARAEASPDHAAMADELIGVADDVVATRVTNPTLFHGFAGVGWAGDHLRALAGAPDLDRNAELDEVMIEHVTAPWSGPIDVVSGLVGYGVYALERDDVPSARRLLAHVVDRLTELARVDRGGLAWCGADGEWDFGVAHGTPGVIGLLASCVAAGGEVAAAARPLLDAAVGWLLARRRGDELATTFPAIEAPTGTANAARSGWCYGDAAVALVLARAARVGDPAWMEPAIAIARRAAARPADETGVRDATLCHGAAGLVQIYSRLHQVTGDETCRAAAHDWLARMLELRVDEPALHPSAGFYQATREGRRASLGMLDGAVGIGLVLLGATSGSSPDWDRALLLT